MAHGNNDEAKKVKKMYSGVYVPGLDDDEHHLGRAARVSPSTLPDHTFIRKLRGTVRTQVELWR